jgi:hypothetical protein
MAAQVWDHDDAGYEQWLASHPQGFMANTHGPIGGRHYKIHAASRSLPDRSKPETTHPRTGNCYLKVAGDTLEELEAWANPAAWMPFTAPASPNQLVTCS